MREFRSISLLTMVGRLTGSLRGRLTANGRNSADVNWMEPPQLNPIY